MNPTTTTTRSGIHALLDAFVRAHADADAEAIRALFTPDAVLYTLAPPLQQQPGDTAGAGLSLEKWLATFDGGVGHEFRDPDITVDGDVAYLTSLTRMSATPKGAPEPFSFWYRTTWGLRRIDGGWRIAHAHDSVPFYMDGSFRIATDLQP